MRSSWRTEWQGGASPGKRASCIAAAMVCSFLVCGLLFRAAGASPTAAFVALMTGGFGSWRAVTETLVRATPLILTGLATAVAFRARIWNIGAEGQVFAGAMLAYFCQTAVADSHPLVQVAVVILGALAGGALYAGVAAALKTRFNVDEDHLNGDAQLHHPLRPIDAAA